MANQGGDGGNPMEPSGLEKAMGWGDGLNHSCASILLFASGFKKTNFDCVNT